MCVTVHSDHDFDFSLLLLLLNCVNVVECCCFPPLHTDPSLPRTTVQLSENGAAVVHDEEGFATFEMRRSQRGTLRSTRPKAPKAPPAAIASAANMQHEFPVYAK